MIIEICFTMILTFLLYHAFASMWKPKNFPPGPLGVPFFGSFHYIIPDLQKSMPQFFKKYGNILGLKLKGRNVVCISGYKLIKEVMVDHPRPFSNRVGFLSQKLVRGDNLEGIATALYGPKWATHRKLFHTVIRKMGLSKKNFDHIIIEELPHFIDEMQSQQHRDRAVDPSQVFEYSVLNVLAYFVFGNRYSYGDAKFKRLMWLNNKFFELVVKASTFLFLLVSFIPFLHKFWLPTDMKKLVECSKEIEDFVAEEIEYHKATLDANSPRDMIDHYLIEMTNQNHGYYTENGLLMTVMDLFQAGTETTSTTLKWAVLYMVNNPKIQEKVQCEIDKVLGTNKLPTYDDRTQMPYTEATIMEVQRKANIAPIGLLHATNEDIQLQGYNLPKNTCIAAFYTSLHHSPEHWKKPNHFDPENQKGIQLMSRRYGNVFSVKLGDLSFVCISGFDLVKEVMVDNPKPYSSRPDLFRSKLTRGQKREGIVVADYGPEWIAHRKLFFTTLNRLGFGSSGKVAEELPFFIDNLETDSPIDLSTTFDQAVLNILASFIFGQRFPYSDARFKHLLQCNNIYFEQAEKANSPAMVLVALIPFLHKLWLPKAGRDLVSSSRDIEDFVENEIHSHKASLDPDHPRDVIDMYLISQASPKPQQFTPRGVVLATMDFFQAGTQTTATTLRWTVLYMVNNQDVQAKVQTEIDEVIGRDRWPSYEDRTKMPYTQATIMEAQRKATITPIGVPHSTSEDVRLNGYDLPKGTGIIAHYHDIHQSPEHWKNPSQFDPNNFLNEDRTVGAREAFMPFGGGLRICPGMQIAKQELFLFLVAMLQRFKILPPPGISRLDEEYVNGGTLQPKSYKIVLRERK